MQTIVRQFYFKVNELRTCPQAKISSVPKNLAAILVAAPAAAVV
jgi:hypothetical protein